MGFGIWDGIWDLGWDFGIWDGIWDFGMGGILPFPSIWAASIGLVILLVNHFWLSYFTC